MITCMYYTTPCIKVQRVVMAASPWIIKTGARLAPQMVSKNFHLDKVKGPAL